jgi:hypothetical protein
MPEERLAAELIAMAAEDERVRAQLAANGSLFDGYHPDMAALHRRHATRLRDIIEAHGWPGRALVGETASDAAWIILQHAIGDPALQRRGVTLLWAAAARGDATAAQAAALEDRVLVLEGRSQRYGTQHDWDEAGQITPLPIEDAPGVDARRRSVGLGPLAETTRHLRDQAARADERPPLDLAARRRAIEQWACATGWRTVPR